MNVRIREGVYDAETERGLALLDGSSGEYYDLNETGTLVLRTLLAGGTEADAARALAERYDVDRGDAERDVADLLEQLHSACLIEGGVAG